MMRIRRISAIAVASVLYGCAQDRPLPPSYVKNDKSLSSGTQDANAGGASAREASVLPAIVATSLFEMKAVAQDAVDYTFGVGSVAFKNEVSTAAVTERFLYVSDPSRMSQAQKDAILPLCRDLVFAPGAESQLTWRSHYSLTIKRVLADVMANGQTEVLCVLKITDSRVMRFLAFDPVPLRPEGIAGTAKSDQAIAQSLMLPALDSQSLISKNLIGLEEPAVVVSAAKALKADTITLTALEDSGSPCYYDTSKPGSVLGNPANPKKSQLALKVPSLIKIQGFMPIGIGGRLQKNCAKVVLAGNEDSVQAQYSCQTYQDIKTEGLEAGCQWELEMANSADLADSVGVMLKMPTLSFKKIDPNIADEVLTLLPKDPLNPVRGKSTVFTGFSVLQAKYAELAFDIWLAVYPKSFIDDFKDYMKSVVVSDTCEQGIGGFARVNSTSFTWCSPNLTESINNPSRPVFHTILVAHETRHSRGWTHDIDNASYAPCQGSAASAAVMHAIVATCKEDYCAVLRNAAVNEYITELNYSLKGDPRRLLGQCKEWSTAMGLTDSLFPLAAAPSAGDRSALTPLATGTVKP